MRVPRHHAASRLLGAIGIASAPAFVWFGWWQLAITGGLVLAAAVLAPRPTRAPGESAARRALRSLERRVRPHSWRPRWR
jgi:hypothetical protein